MKTQATEQHANVGSFAKTPWIALMGLIVVSTMMLAPPAFAQKVSGALTFTAPRGASWTLSGSSSGSGFTEAGRIDPFYTTFQVLCFPCFSSVMVDGEADGTDAFLTGNAVTWSSSVPSVFPSLDWGALFNWAPGSHFTITGNPISITGPGTYSTPFTFTGSLCGTVTPYSCSVSEANLTGSGQVIVYIAKHPSGFLYTTQATYIFLP